MIRIRDFQKLIFYYYADHYINFKDLITELYRIYKTRIWLSAINPASFSQHALGQPPSGIGPGAVGSFNQNLNNTYTMMYGPDPDPYGAIPPYQIGYDTYTPNYPGIPGVANSFAPNPPMSVGYQSYGSGGGESTPSVPPGVTPTGTSADYNYYYDRNTGSEQTPKAYAAPSVFSNPAPSTNTFYPSMYGGLQTPWGSQNVPSMGGADQRGEGRAVYSLETLHALGGPRERGFGGSTYPQSSYQSIGSSNERPGLGYGLVPPTFKNNPFVSNVAAGFGRQTTLPAPIGTRPESKGKSMLTPTSNPTQETRSTTRRLPNEFVPNQQIESQMGGLSLQGGGDGNTGSD